MKGVLYFSIGNRDLEKIIRALCMVGESELCSHFQIAEGVRLSGQPESFFENLAPQDPIWSTMPKRFALICGEIVEVPL